MSASKTIVAWLATIMGILVLMFLLSSLGGAF